MPGQRKDIPLKLPLGCIALNSHSNVEGGDSSCLHFCTAKMSAVHRADIFMNSHCPASFQNAAIIGASAMLSMIIIIMLKSSEGVVLWYIGQPAPGEKLTDSININKSIHDRKGCSEGIFVSNFASASIWFGGDQNI